MVSGKASVEAMLAGGDEAGGRRRGWWWRRRIDFDEEASSHSTLLQVVAQDVPGLLRAISADAERAGI